MKALYDGVCVECGGPIRTGQEIEATCDAGGGWRHHRCPTPPTTCTTCFMQKPCECDDE